MNGPRLVTSFFLTPFSLISTHEMMYCLFTVKLIYRLLYNAGIRKKKDKNRYSTTDTENGPFPTESNSEKSSDAGNSLYEAGPSNVRAQVQVEVLDENRDKKSPETEDELVCEAGTSMAEPEQSCCTRTGMTIIIVRHGLRLTVEFILLQNFSRRGPYAEQFESRTSLILRKLFLELLALTCVDIFN
ncbi:hypothetical protein QAD02_023934 [Eretmocerus hayati]|uniref:Uncharacterized protein n=1 Tax=Eretmocerus hayati TaxID=131215 RepID=A0ACC2PXY7_9HYME|nr:hypothetical protein QAD02_023934 [Eretmocerus hayati]